MNKIMNYSLKKYSFLSALVMAVVVNPAAFTSALSQDADESIMITEEGVMEYSSSITYEEAMKEGLPPLETRELPKIRRVIWGYFQDIEYVWEEQYVDVESSGSDEWVSSSEFGTTTYYTVLDTPTAYIPLSEDIGYKPDSYYISSSYSEPATTSTTWSSTYGGRSHWDETAGRVIYSDGLTLDDMYGELSYLYRMSIITPGQYHNEKARLNGMQ